MAMSSRATVVLPAPTGPESITTDIANLLAEYFMAVILSADESRSRIAMLPGSQFSI
jgi:hypothetical protein